jgi:hypothetical protein
VVGRSRKSLVKRSFQRGQALTMLGEGDAIVVRDRATGEETTLTLAEYLARVHAGEPEVGP